MAGPVFRAGLGSFSSEHSDWPWWALPVSVGADGCAMFVKGWLQDAQN